MNRLILIAATMTACTEADTTGTVDDPRAVSCDSFRTIDYQVAKPVQSCYFDVSDLDWARGPFVDSTPLIISGCEGTSCRPGGSGSQFVDADTFKDSAIRWTGDTEYGVAVVIGGDDFDTPIPEWKCIWKRCTRVE